MRVGKGIPYTCHGIDVDMMCDTATTTKKFKGGTDQLFPEMDFSRLPPLPCCGCNIRREGDMEGHKSLTQSHTMEFCGLLFLFFDIPSSGI